MTTTRDRSPGQDPSRDDTDPRGQRFVHAPATTPRPARRVPGRRPMAAGHVLVVLVVAAVVGSLLNAAGIRKTASGQPVGIRRDVARFFAEPLYDVSHALQFDELRKGIQSIAGRTGDDDINTSLPDPITVDNPTNPTDPTAVTTTTAPPKKQAFSPTRRLKVWIGGDSLSITPGESFVSIAPGTEVIEVSNNFVDGHVATGLARPEVFNWPDHMLNVIAADQPNALVITLGSNDDQNLTGEGGAGPYASPEWMTEYRRRVGGMMDALTANSDRILFWVGVPVLRVRAEDRYNPINQIFREEAEKRRGRVVFIDLDSRFRGPDGGYVDIVNDVQVRTPDGVHFSRAGGDRVAQMVIDALHEAYDLSSWRTKGTTATTAPK